MASTAVPLLELDSVSRLYEHGRVHAVNSVSFAINAGEFVAVVGPSGSGKTTLLNLMAGLDQPTTGTVRFAGQTPKHSAGWTRLRSREIGFVFQAYHLLPTLSALENVQVPMFGIEGSAGRREARARALLEAVDLAGRAAHRPHQLSGGEKQRVAFARSLANRPRVVLADEPTGNLDSASAAAVMEILVRLVRAEGVALVLVTHNPSLAAGADRVVEFVDGTVARVEERRRT